MNHLKEKILNDFKVNPYSLWAKKFDSELHIPHQMKKGDGTLCGSSSALLGNNYAPHKKDLPICNKCLEIKYNEHK